MEIFFILALGIAEGLLAASIIMILSRTGVVDWYSLHRGRLPDWCFFCVGFWLCVLASVDYFLWYGTEPFKWVYVICPFIGAAISNKFIYK